MHSSIRTSLRRGFRETGVTLAAVLATGSLLWASPVHAMRDSGTGLKAKKGSVESETLAVGSSRDLARIRVDLAAEDALDVIVFEPSRSTRGSRSKEKRHADPRHFDRRSAGKFEPRSPYGSGSAPVPEPASALLLGLGGLIVGGAVRRRP